MYSIVCAKRDTLRDASSICKTRVTYVTLMDDPYWLVTKEEEEKQQKNLFHRMEKIVQEQEQGQQEQRLQLSLAGSSFNDLHHTIREEYREE